MRYDIDKRGTPVPFSIHNYGTQLEGIRYGILTPEGPISDEDIFLRAEKELTRLMDHLWVTPPIPHEELKKYYLVINMTDMDDYGAIETDRDPHYIVDIEVVCPYAVTKKTLKSAMDSCGPEDPKLRRDVLCKVQALVEYGRAAHVWQASGDDHDELFREAVKRLTKIRGLLGFYMDQPQNRIGESGWSWACDEEVLNKETAQ
jgi:hypothetical protein